MKGLTQGEGKEGENKEDGRRIIREEKQNRRRTKYPPSQNRYRQSSKRYILCKIRVLPAHNVRQVTAHIQ